MTRKNLSKMAAAYNACKELHRIGELDDDLLPVRSLSSDEESELEEEDADSGDMKKAKAGTKKRKRIYERKVRSYPLGIVFPISVFAGIRTSISIRLSPV